MSSNKTHKWSSSTTLTKFLSRISRTLSFSSKKSRQTLKNNNKKVQPTEIIVKNVNFMPQSAPVIRRHPSQSISKILYIENSTNKTSYRQIIHQNMYVKNGIEEEENDDYSRYSLRPNLSLFNISTENLNYQSEECYQQVPRQRHWPDNILHSTKIEDY